MEWDSRAFDGRLPFANVLITVTSKARENVGNYIKRIGNHYNEYKADRVHYKKDTIQTDNDTHLHCKYVGWDEPLDSHFGTTPPSASKPPRPVPEHPSPHSWLKHSQRHHKRTDSPSHPNHNYSPFPWAYCHYHRVHCHRCDYFFRHHSECQEAQVHPP